MTNKILTISALFLGLVSTAAMAEGMGESCNCSNCPASSMSNEYRNDKMKMNERMDMMDKQAKMDKANMNDRMDRMDQDANMATSVKKKK